MEFKDMPAYLHDFNQVLRFELTSNLRDQEQEPVNIKLPPDAEHKGKKASKGETPAQVLVNNIPKAMALLEKMKQVLPITGWLVLRLANDPKSVVGDAFFSCSQVGSVVLV
ncbi:MAG: hypothetical protein EHM41_24075 [Chloroflexi bacterium]|nr:MAG: hypothetical protein EHM41_24075 [Chloroflexota bacterium]